MSSWAERVHKRAADLGSVVTSCGHPGTSTPSYPYRLEKVKFGVALEEVCKNDNIPGPLLVLILKLNKESPNRRDVFRAPGHQGAMKKLIHFLQAGRLVNVDNYSVYTIASVLKKFLRKIPNGIFGRSGEKELFAIIELDNEVEQTDRLHRLFTSLPKYTQHLLVLLFGTFRVIASNAAPAATGMTSEALGVSVAPSFFQSCVSDGKTARMEDVLKFKVATKIMKHIIDKFATNDLFGRENYEYYARVTGRILKVQDEWICSFQYPPPPRGKLAQQKYALQHSLEAEKTWLQCQCERWGLLAQEESRSTPALLTSSSSAVDNSVLSLGVSPEHSFIESCARLSVSLEGPGLFAMTSSPLPKRNSIRGDEVFMVQHRRMQRDIEDDDFTIGEGELDYDESNYGDDDDDDDGGEITGAINRDYENYGKNVCLNDSGLIEKQQQQQQRQLKMTPKPKPTLSSKKKQIRKAALAVGSTAAAAAGVGIGLNEVERIAYGNAKNVGDDNDDDDDGDGDVDGDDDDDAMITANKRRYRQNKKTTTQARNLQQHARRLRAGSKSLDGTATAIEMKSQAKAHAQAQRNMDSIAIKSKSSQAKTKPMKQPKASAQAGGTTKPPPPAAAAAAGGALTTTATTASSGVGAGSGSLRTCSRCNRGIRHSSSCSSASGGAANGAGNNPNGGNNSGMTMEELRAVNRYAESTKSLSYLPQVHERQTARMHTRSEWFLSGGDGIGDGMTLQLPIACSNCCLYATEECYQQQVEEHKQERERKQRQHDGQQEKQQQLLQQQQQQQKTYYFPHNYLGGGSTRDMRPRADEYEDDAFFLFHKQRHHNQQHQQKQQQQQQRQQLQCNIPLQLNSLAKVYIDAPGITCCSESNDFHMDTDENIAINHQQQQQLHQQDDYHQQQKQKQQQQQQQRMQQNLMLSANFSHSTSTKATTATYLLKPTTTTTTTTTKTTTTTTTGTGVCNLSSSLDGSSEANSTNPQSNSKATNIEIDDAFIGYQQRSNVLMDTRIVSNIRLSNSAESVQCPSRRPATVRRLIGHSNIPRQYPLRASLRRNKEKQIGSGGNGNSGGGSNSNSNSNINSGCKNSTNNLNNNQNTNNFTNNKNDSNSNSNSNMNNNNHNSGSKNCNVVIPSNNGNHHSDNNTSMFVADDIRINRTLGFGSTNQPPSVRNSIAECYGNILAPTSIGNRLEPKRAVSLKTTYVDATENVAKTIVDIADNNRLLNYTTAQFGNIIPPIASSTTNTSTSINTNTNMERNSTMPTFVRQRNNTTIPTPPIISSTITSPLITTTALATEKTVYSKQQQQQSSSAMQDPDEMKTTISNTVTFKTPRV